MTKQAVIIRFVTDAEKAIIAELDSEMNDDATEFYYDTKAYFKVYTHPESLSIKLTPTDGVITNEGSGISNEEETINFINTREASVSKPVKTISSYVWLGNNLGSVSAEGVEITTSKEGLGICRINYKAKFRRYAIKVSEKEYDEYPVIVLISEIIIE